MRRRNMAIEPPLDISRLILSAKGSATTQSPIRPRDSLWMLPFTMCAPRLGLIALLVLAMLLLVPCVSSAQELPTAASEPQTSVFFSGGFGLGSLDFGGYASLSVGRGGGDVAVRWAKAQEFNLFTAEETSQDIAVLYGRRRSGSIGWLRAAAGLGVAYGVHRGDRLPGACYFGCSYEEERHTTLGLALQFDAVWAPLRSLGLGLSLFGNLNDPGPFGGATVSLHLGRVS